MAVTIRDVADAAGVSPATAARALGHYGSADPSTVSRVLVAAERLGYRTSRLAQALRSGHARTVGFIPADLENPFFAKVTRHLNDAIENDGYTLLVSSSDERPERETRILDTFLAHQVSGVVVAPTAQLASPHLKKVALDKMPLVLIDRRIDDLEVDCVTVDNVGGGYLAASHLIGLGHRRIAIICDSLQVASTADRFVGYQKALAERDVAFDPQLIGVAGFSRDEAHAATLRILALSDRPTAIFTTDAFMTEGALRALRDHALAVPSEMSIVGFDDLEPRSPMGPPVTVIAQPIVELGHQAAHLLLDQISGTVRDFEHVDLPTELLIRGSTAPPRDR